MRSCRKCFWRYINDVLAYISAGHFLSTSSEGHKSSSSQMSPVEQAKWKAGLAEQGSSFGDKAKKEGVSSVKARSGGMGSVQGCCLSLQGENLCGQSSIGVEAGQNCGGQKKEFLKLH